MPFRPRRVDSGPEDLDPDGIKLYRVSASGADVDAPPFLARLAEVKDARGLDWAATPAFAILHAGASMDYLVLAWWGNDNELFTHVSVRTPQGWDSDPERWSVCVWDLEILWAERNFFVETVYCEAPDLAAYRARRMPSIPHPGPGG